MKDDATIHEAIGLIRAVLNKGSMMNEKLKPCPFCGANTARLREAIVENEYAHAFSVVCFTCGTGIFHPRTSPTDDWEPYATQEEAMEAWNRRAGDETEKDVI